MPNLTSVTAAQLHAILTANWATINAEFPHIKPFSVDELNDFLAGKPGSIYLKFSCYGRSHQVRQALSGIGARLVDKKLASPETTAVYKQLWAAKCTTTCKYCNKPYEYSFMMGNNNNVCAKSRCKLNHIHDSI